MPAQRSPWAVPAAGLGEALEVERGDR